MKKFRIYFQWHGRNYDTVLNARDAAWAVFMAPLQLMNDARVVGVGPA